MVILGVVIKAYTIINFMIVADEVWNISNPRPYPKAKYYMLEWEEDDFIKMKDGGYLLRPKRKTDNELKRYVRNEYWRKKDLQRMRKNSK